jgi:DNA polymerase III subunit delta'
MRFADVVGQETVKEQLVSMVQQNRLSHALLFLGREGSGGLSLALAFAQYVVCERAGLGAKPAASGGGLFGDEPEMTAPLADSCGVCSACTKAASLMHPDIHFAYPVVPKKSGDKPLSADYINEWRSFVKETPYGNAYDWLQYIGAENKQGNITAHECNEIIRKLSLKSFENGYKILLMWMPEYLGKEGNKLLKLIEEPPPGTVFILVAENEDQVLSTILSRTQLVKIPPVEKAAMEKALLSHTDPARASLAAGAAYGNFREALQLLDHTDQDWLALLRECLNAALKTGPVAMVKWVELAAGLGREKQKQFLKYGLNLLEQSLLGLVAGEQLMHLTPEEKDFAKKLAQMTGLDQLEALAELFNTYIYYIERNAHAKMLFHAFILRIYHIIGNKNVILMQ